jgi:hypothetical protein
MNRRAPRIAALTVATALVGAACGASDDSSASDATTEVAVDVTTTTAPNDEPVAMVAEETPTESDEVSTESAGVTSTFEIDVWADNWMAVYVDGEPIGEDSVPITTERSFNKETFAFEASMPFTLAIKAKDFKETDSGIEYIGLNNQQMGDGGIIAQITDLSTGDVVAGTDSSWAVLVVHQAPLNTECVSDADPDSTCEFLVIDTPADWASAGFDDSNWTTATEWSTADVSPKDGYDEISWDESAQLIWGTDLEVDNTVLLRTTVS